MKLSPYDETQEVYEAKLEKYLVDVKAAESLVKKYDERLKPVDVKDKNKKVPRIDDELFRKLNVIKKETLNHIRRLEKRRNEELEKGCHEYANYLVSMLNAGTKNYLVDS